MVSWGALSQKWEVGTHCQCLIMPIHEGVLKHLHQKNGKISRKIYVVEFPLNGNAQIQSAAYYRTKNSTTDTFVKSAQKEKDVLKVQKFQKKSLWNCPFSLKVTGLQFTISDVSKSRLQEKCFLCVFWNGWKFARERSIMKSFD